MQIVRQDIYNELIEIAAADGWDKQR